jgi:hypothetical protein
LIPILDGDFDVIEAEKSASIQPKNSGENRGRNHNQCDKQFEDQFFHFSLILRELVGFCYQLQNWTGPRHGICHPTPFD